MIFLACRFPFRRSSSLVAYKVAARRRCADERIQTTTAT
jgi:hypothetical protein